MAKVPFHFPFGGRLDTTSHTDHPYLYTREAKNVRARDPVTGRIRGARRSALTKWNASAIGTGRIRALVSTAYDDRKLEYSYTPGGESTLWSAAVPGMGDSLGGCTDSQGNVYALDGASVVKFNSAGKQILKIALPTSDSGHVVRALFVDDGGRVFAGVSGGGDVATAAVWCFLQLQDNEYSLLWTLTPGAYTEELVVYRGAQLYCAHNYPQENRARVLVYEGLGLEPFEASRIESVAYPINGMAVLDGAVYCASEDNLGDVSDGSSGASMESFRPGHPSMRGHHPPVEAWTIKQLDDATKRVWSEYDAADIDDTDLEQTGSVATLDDGQQVLRWRDTSGNNRHWYSGAISISGEAGPTYSKVGPGGLPAVRFTNVGTTKQSLVTLPNASIAKNTADQQRTAIPAHEGAMWALFILMRPATADVAGTDPRVVFYAENDATTGTPGHHGLWVNRACGATQPGTFSLGAISYFAKTDAVDNGSCGGADQAAAGGYTGTNSKFTDCVLVTLLWDGGIDPNDTNKTRCTLRLNGRPIDRFEGLAFESLKANYLGYAPTVATAVANRLNGEICHIVSVGRRDRFDDSTEPKVLTHDLVDFVGDFPAGQNQTDNELARIESWILHKRGLGHLLGGAAGSSNPQDLWTHFYGQTDNLTTTSADHGPSSPPDFDGAGRSTAFEQITQRWPLVSKHDIGGKLLWVCNEITHPDTTTNQGGIGYGVRARKVESDSKVHVWMVGPDEVKATVNGEVGVRKVIDLGASFSGAQADGAWRHKFSGHPTWAYAYPRMASDKFGNLFVPGNETGSGTMRPLHIFAKDPDGSGNADEVTTYLLPGSSSLAHAVALPPDSMTPEYRDDFADEIAERVYVFTADDAVPGSLEAVYAVGLVEAAAVASGTPRTVVTLAVTEDDIRVVTDSTNAVASGGTAVLDGTAQYVQALRAGDDIVFLDGVNYYAYSLRDGTVARLESTSAGEIPPRAKYAFYWRHRLMLVAFADNPYNYAASRLGNIRDWNLRPGALPTGEQIQTSTQSFTGTLTRAGEAAEPIVTGIPVWDDLCYIIGESRILRLTGDPQDGGNIHLVTDSMGGTFGDSWCKDSTGRVFMFGSAPPGLYQLLPDRDPVPLSRHTLEESEFADIDFSTHRMLLCWNPIDKGVHIFQVAWGTSSVVDHWFWEERTHRLVRSPPLWTDSFGSADLQPTSVTYLGGDDTRCLLIGCSDGYIRKWDPAALTDDGEPVDGYFMAKLTPGGGPSADWLVREIQVALADDQGGALLEMFSSETADSPGAIQESYDLTAGLNEAKRIRLRGAHLWARVRSAAAERWAWESGEVDIVPRGKPTPGDA